MANVIKKNGDNLVAENAGLVSVAAGVALSPLKMFGSSTDATQTFYSEQVVGATVLGALAGGFVVGDMFGHKIPLLGRRRKTEDYDI